MAINIAAKTNYNFLFSSLNTSSGASDLTGLLSNYSSIKNGSYGKLMKSYYSPEVAGKHPADKLTTSSAASSILGKTATKALSKVQTGSDSLKEAADDLLEGKKFAGETVSEEAYKAVSSFVSGYNTTITAAGDSDSSTVTARTNTLKNYTTQNTKELAAVGITVEKDGTLKLDKDAFMASSTGKLQNLFTGKGSYGYVASAQASLINYAADTALNTASGIYGSRGTYTAATGALFNGFM